jgi:hypothetical protein
MSQNALESALHENLRARGVWSRLATCLNAEVACALKGVPLAAPASQDPSTHLVDALIVEYLQYRGFRSSLSIFCAETGALPPLSASTLSLSPPGVEGPPPPATKETLWADEEVALGAKIAQGVAERLLRASAGAVSTSLPPQSVDAVASYLRVSATSLAPTPTPDPQHHLPRALVVKELGVRGGGPAILSLVAAARKVSGDTVASIPGWLGGGVGSQAELKEAIAAIESAAAAQKTARALQQQQQQQPSSPPSSLSPTVYINELKEEALAFDSDEEIPGALARVSAYMSRATLVGKAAVEGGERAEMHFQVIGEGDEGFTVANK